MQRKSSTYILNIAVVGVMAALVYASSLIQFQIPLGPGGVTRVHLGNSMCLLAALLFGRLRGGLAAGIGSGIFDLLDPIFLPSFPFTFSFKFLMGFVCGTIALGKNKERTTKRNIIGAILGQLTYIVLYLGKSYIELKLEGAATGTALVAVGQKGVASSINAIIAVIVSVVLYNLIAKPLSKTSFAQFLKG